MQGPGAQVYPTAPAGMALRPEDGVTPPANPLFAEGGEPLESPGKAKSPLSKVKNKAKKLKDKIKKVTGSNTISTPHGHGDLGEEQKVIQGDRAFPPHPPPYEQVDADGSYEEEDDDEEDADHTLQDADHTLLGDDDKSKFEQLQRPGLKDQPGDGSEVEVHGGVPASALDAAPGTNNDEAVTTPVEGAWIADNAPISHHDSAEAKDNGPISPYKSSGPPGTLQAAPTEYHYTPEDDQQMLKGDERHNALPQQPKPSQFEDVPYTSLSNQQKDVPYTSRNDIPSKDTPYEQLKPSDDVTHTSQVEAPEDSQIEANSLRMPPSADEKRFEGPGYTSLDGSSPEFSPSTDVNRSAESRDALSRTEPAALESPKRGVDVTYPDDIVKPNPEFGRSSSPMHDKIAVINEDLPAEARLDAGLAPEEYGSQESRLDKSVPENVPLTFEEENASDKPALNAVAGPPLTPSADEEKPTTGISERLANTEQEGYEPFTGASGTGFTGRDEPLARDDREEEGTKETAPQTFAAGDSVDGHPTSDAFTGRDEPLATRNDREKEGTKETAPETFAAGDSADRHPTSDAFTGRDEPLARDDREEEGTEETAPQTFAAGDSVDRHPTSDAFEGSSFMPLADKTARSDAVVTRDGGFNDHVQSSERQSPGAGVYANDESLVTAIGDRTSDDAKDGQKVGLLSASNGNDSNQSVSGQRQSDFDIAADLPVSDNLSSDDSHVGQTVPTAGSHQESWGKWSADKLNNAKDAVATSEMASDRSAHDAASEGMAADAGPGAVTTLSGKHGYEAPLGEEENATPRESTDNDATPAFGAIAGADADEVKGLPGHQDISTHSNAQPGNVKEDVEYYDPNNSSDNQFQEGFAEGTGQAEEEALNGTLAGSTIGKLQGFSDVVATKLGLTNSPHLNDSVENANPEGRTDDVSNPLVESDPSQQTGDVQTGDEQGLKNMVASSLGYGEATSPKPSYEHESRTQPAVPVEDEQAVTTQSQQQSGGAFQGLKNVFASKLGYGARDQQPLPNEQTLYDESGEQANAVRAGYSPNEDVETIPSQQQSGGALQGLRNVVASKLGYPAPTQKPAADTMPEGIADATSHAEVPAAASNVVDQKVSGGNPPSGYTQMLFDTAANAKDYLSSKVGIANGKQERAVEDRNTSYEDKEKPTSAV